MNSNGEKVKIIMPVEDVEISFEIDVSKNNHRIFIHNIEDSKAIEELIQQKKIQPNKAYECEYLFCADDQGTQYTFYDVSLYFAHHGIGFYLYFSFGALLYNGHIEDLNKISIDKIELETDYRIEIKRDFVCNDIRIVVEPQYEFESGLVEWFGEAGSQVFNHKIQIICVGKLKFEECEKIIWRLSEFFFLCCEDMISCGEMTVYIEGNSYTLRNFGHTNDWNSHPKWLYSKSAGGKNFCYQALNEENFLKFMSFRAESGIIFDVFRTTTYSNSFLEDYPLRFSQAIEGLANYLGVADTEKRRDTFNSVIQLSLHCNDYIKEQLPKSSNIQEFAKKITEHRNKFSHVKSKGNYLQGDDNEVYAEILYTTIRVLIMKYLKNEL